MQSRFCSRCQQEHPLESFAKQTKSKDGLGAYCKGCRREKKAEWYADNKDRADTYNKVYRDNNPEFMATISARNSIYQKENRHLPQFKVKKNSREAKRRSAKLFATPLWLTQHHLKEIEQIYWLAQDIKVTSGQEYHVDHIVPLQGKSVCGLHVPWNLQVLPSEINLSKSNKV